MNRNDVAQICHEVNKAYCESLGDLSQASWEEAPQWQRDSALKGVNYHLDNPDSLPSDSHASWYKEKEENGWVFGPNKDAELKTHPCMVPFENLPTDQQAKDYLFLQIVRSLEPFITVEANTTVEEEALEYTTTNAPLMTFGQRAVGLKFNPSNDDEVGRCKQMFADAIDQMDSLRQSTEDPEVRRMASVAITDAQSAQMWAVKAITWKY